MLVRDGQPTNYSEERATAIFREPSFLVMLTCGMGDGWATVWTCDLTHGYIDINAAYRT